MSVTIPDSVTEMGIGAFSNCEDLRDVVIGAGLATIPDYAFYNDVGLETVTIPSTVTEIAGSAFQYNEALYPGYSGYVTVNVEHGDTERVKGIMDGSNLPITYVEAPATYWIVAFDGNGGDSEEAMRKVSLGAAVGALPAATREGYTLKGWYTAASGGSKISASVKVTEDVTYYAQWTKDDDPQSVTYTVMFDVSGGAITSGSETKQLESGKAVGELPTATRNGYSLSGWYTSKTGGLKISATTIVTFDVVYFAQWEVNKYEVTFDANGGTGGMSASLAYESEVTAPVVTRLGYTFVGWSPTVDVTVPASNVTYTARWRKQNVVEFESPYVSANEGELVTVRVIGGNLERASTVKAYLAYNSATAADVDLKGLKFPIALAWNAGEIGAKEITIPIKADKAVEADEVFTLQLADAVGIEMGEATVCTVTVKDPTYAELAAKVANFSATPQERKTWDKLQRNGAVYVRGLVEPADGGKVSGGNYCPEGKKVTLKATAAKGFRFVGWRRAGDGTRYQNGYAATTPSLVVDRTTTPAANTKSSTTITGVADDATYRAVFVGEPRVSSVLENYYGGVNMDAGKVSGTGRYAAGKKVTVKATANKGYVFCGWQRVGETSADNIAGYVSQAASYSFVMGAKDVDLVAEFVTVAEDVESIWLDVDKNWMTEANPMTRTIHCGVAVNWPVDSGALSATTVKASGLPSGLKLVQDKVTKAYSVVGAPTAASKKRRDGDLTPFRAKFTVTTTGKSKQEFAMDIVVEPLPAWAVGTFNGRCEWNEGLVPSFTIAPNGKISGKVIESGKTWILSAAAFAEYVESRDVYVAEVVAKSGNDVGVNVVTVCSDEVNMPYSVNGRGARYPSERGVVTATVRGRTALPEWTAWQNLWKIEPWKTVARPFGKSPQVENQYRVMLKCASSGAVTAKYYGHSCTTTIIPDGGNNYVVPVYFPPKGTFPGYGEDIPIVGDDDVQAFTSCGSCYWIGPLSQVR